MEELLVRCKLFPSELAQQLLSTGPTEVVVRIPEGASNETKGDVLIDLGSAEWRADDAGIPGIVRPTSELFDSFAIPHDYRFEMFLPSKEEVLGYKRAVRASVDGILSAFAERQPASSKWAGAVTYLCTLCVQHENMHSESLLMNR